MRCEIDALIENAPHRLNLLVRNRSAATAVANKIYRSVGPQNRNPAFRRTIGMDKNVTRKQRSLDYLKPVAPAVLLADHGQKSGDALCGNLTRHFLFMPRPRTQSEPMVSISVD